MPNFTKGTWRAVYYTPKYITINGGIYLISSSSEDDVAFTPSLADARLIAAAPEMYDLLYEAMQELKGYEPIENGISTIWPDIEELLNRIDGKESNP